jgi:polysaccharide export outer membrane protein
MPSLRCKRAGLTALFALSFLALGSATYAIAQEQSPPADATPANAAAQTTTAAVATEPADRPKIEPAAPQTVQPKPEPAMGGVGPDSTLRLGVGDLINVSVYNVPELASKARIGEGGDVYLPLIDYVHVAGLTADEAQGIIEKRLADGGFVKNPHVSIFVDQYASQGASVLGEIGRPGVYPVIGKQRLFDLISAAGGLGEKAGSSVTVTHRGQSDKPATIPLARNLTDNPSSNIEIFPGDTIIVRKADIVYVVGDVARPSGILVDRGSMTVLQAVALSGGANRTAKLNGAKIIHKGANSNEMTETPVQLKKILEAKAPDLPMKPDDILFVPSSSIKSALSGNASIAMQAASLGLVMVH